MPVQVGEVAPDLGGTGYADVQWPNVAVPSGKFCAKFCCRAGRGVFRLSLIAQTRRVEGILLFRVS